MRVATAIFTGSHRCQPTRVLFTLVAEGGWIVSMACGDKRHEVRVPKAARVSPCPTHASRLLEQWLGGGSAESQRRAKKIKAKPNLKVKG